MQISNLTIFSIAVFVLTPHSLSAAGSPFNPDAKSSAQVDSDVLPSEVIQWSAGSARFRSDGSVEVGLRMVRKGDWTVYQDNLQISAQPGFKLIELQDPPTHIIADPLSGENKAVYDGGDFFIVFQGPPLAANSLNPPLEMFTVNIKYLGCTSSICLFPYTETLRLPTSWQDPAPTANDTDKNAQAINTADSATTFKESDYASQLLDANISFQIMLLIALLGGLMTNLTPCVFPMIPITVRLLGQQKDRPLLNSSLYGAGIFISYTILGVSAAATGSLFGAFMSNPWVNVAFALMMMALGFSMLGYGNLAVLQNIGMRLGSGKPSLTNYFLMGAGAGLVAAPCTGPILGALLTFTAQSQDLVKGSSLLAIYSFGFALPYVFLGGFSGHISRIKVDDRLINFIKILFAAIMFGLGFYYLRIPFYGIVKQISAYWSSIALANSALAFALLAIWSWQKKLRQSKKFSVILCIAFGLCLFSLAQFLTTKSHSDNDSSLAQELTWLTVPEQAYALAKQTGRPLFIDAWAEWCEACKKMDRTTFVEPSVIKAFQEMNWILLKRDMTDMQTDDNVSFQETYELAGLPSYIFLYLNEGSPKVPSQVISGFIEPQDLIAALKKFSAQKKK